MRWPWVSREAYEERGRRIEALEKHLEQVYTLSAPQTSPFWHVDTDGSVDLPTVEIPETEDVDTEREEIARERSRLLSGEF